MRVVFEMKSNLKVVRKKKLGQAVAADKVTRLFSRPIFLYNKFIYESSEQAQDHEFIHKQMIIAAERQQAAIDSGDHELEVLYTKQLNLLLEKQLASSGGRSCIFIANTMQVPNCHPFISSSHDTSEGFAQA